MSFRPDSFATHLLQAICCGLLIGAAALVSANSPRENAGRLLDAISIQRDALQGLVPELEHLQERRLQKKLKERERQIVREPVRDSLSPEPIRDDLITEAPLENKNLIVKLPEARSWSIEIITLLSGTAQILLLPKIPQYIYNVRIGSGLGYDIRLVNEKALVQVERGSNIAFVLAVPESIDPSNYVQLFKFHEEAGHRVMRAERQGFVYSHNQVQMDFQLSVNYSGGVPEGFLLWEARPRSKLSIGEYGFILDLPQAARHLKGNFANLGDLESVVYDFSVD